MDDFQSKQLTNPYKSDPKRGTKENFFLFTIGFAELAFMGEEDIGVYSTV